MSEPINDRTAQAQLRAVKAALAGHPRCDTHPDDDPITCGWKHVVANVQHALNNPTATSQEDTMTHALTVANPLLEHSTDSDECNACEFIGGQCPYHRGVEAGIEQARAALAAFAESA